MGKRPGIGSAPDPLTINHLIFGGGVICVDNMAAAAVHTQLVERFGQMLTQHIVADTTDKTCLRSLQLGVYGNIHCLSARIGDHIRDVFIHFGIPNANNPNHFSSTFRFACLFLPAKPVLQADPVLFYAIIQKFPCKDLI